MSATVTRAMARTLVARLPDWDRDDVAAFAPVLDALDLLTPYVEVLEPGAVAVPLRPGAGDEAAFCETLIDTISALTDQDCVTGVADGLFAAVLAAREGRLVPAGGDAAFLAGHPIDALTATGLVEAEVCETLRHLGIETLGAFVALPGQAVAERFGPLARRAQHLAAGRLARPLTPRPADPDLTVAETPDDPYGTIEQAVFAARPLAERLKTVLDERNLTCTRLTITARTVSGLIRERTWQVDPSASTADLARRVRWQLEGWGIAARGAATEGEDGVAVLALAPGGLIGLLEAGKGLWDAKNATTARAEAALRHTQTLLGPEAVRVATATDGRDLTERAVETAWEVEAPPPPASGPWPGALPDPPPAFIGDDKPVTVLDVAGAPVTVAARGDLSATPALVVSGGKQTRVVAWAGPWPVHERWWSEESRRYARLQVELADGSAALLACEGGQWKAVGWYD
ncbi:DNA polymerase Y family protein [Glycomyces buryatensis]|uniref:DNA polymerase Y family protein n=1 Tax=Glycomyces buryatensis TaxID=2570927 RepID=A0A4S8QBZ7_9ACTN|nr:DNA polymerase Y family protein [Glycomyces buryatensis]THV42037.1 DNA polymerase Y family protein [Glycomyces buryatensis]